MSNLKIAAYMCMFTSKNRLYNSILFLSQDRGKLPVISRHVVSEMNHRGVHDLKSPSGDNVNFQSPLGKSQRILFSKGDNWSWKEIMDDVASSEDEKESDAETRNGFGIWSLLKKDWRWAYLAINIMQTDSNCSFPSKSQTLALPSDIQIICDTYLCINVFLKKQFIPVSKTVPVSIVSTSIFKVMWYISREMSSWRHLTF